jgi:glutathione S-transferase
MTTTLYYSRNPKPRLCVAVARYLNAPAALEWAARLEANPAWAAPFAGLKAPHLPPIAPKP